MMTPREKYESDAAYHNLVCVLEGLIHKADYTPSELREACIYACIRYESYQVRVMNIPINSAINDAMRVMEGFICEGKS
jgi:hypothetical protein